MKEGINYSKDMIILYGMCIHMMMFVMPLNPSCATLSEEGGKNPCTSIDHENVRKLNVGTGEK